MSPWPSHVLAEVQRRWPSLTLSDESAREVSGEHAAEVALAFCATRGDVEALRIIDADYLEPLAAKLAARHGRAVVDDALQRVRQRLFVGTEGSAPRALDFTGQGSLHAWLRSVVTREVLALLPPSSPEGSAEDALLVDSASDVELEALRRAHGADFERAFAESVAELPRRDRLLLRMNALDGLSVDKLAAIFHAPRSSVGRWLLQARAAVLRGTKERLMTSLQLSDSQAESLIRALRPAAEISLRRLLSAE